MFHPLRWRPRSRVPTPPRPLRLRMQLAIKINQSFVRGIKSSGGREAGEARCGAGGAVREPVPARRPRRTHAYRDTYTAAVSVNPRERRRRSSVTVLVPRIRVRCGAVGAVQCDATRGGAPAAAARVRSAAWCGARGGGAPRCSDPMRRCWPLPLALALACLLRVRHPPPHLHDDPSPTYGVPSSQTYTQ